MSGPWFPQSFPFEVGSEPDAVKSGARSTPNDRLPGEVTAVPLSRLRLWPENPRRISQARLEDLKQALVTDPAMLWARPLLALPDGTIFSGNQRLRAGQELGWTTIPVRFVNLDRERARLWALRDNNIYGEWHEPALAELLAELQAGGVDLALSGFASSDLDAILARLPSPRDPDAVPPLPAHAECRPGEIYELGGHRVMCGDATDPGQVAELLAGLKAELYWSDPPWGVDYVGKGPDALTIANDSEAGLFDLLTGALTVAGSALVPSAPFYLASPAGPQGTIVRSALRTAGWRHRESLVWVKNSIVLGHGDHHYRHEEILYGATPGPGRPGRGRHRGSRWYGGDAASSVFFVDRPSRSANHPTQKPIELVAAMVRDSSRRGEVVLDSFAGSGSTLIACEQLGRRCMAMELDPRYVDVIRSRFEHFTDATS